MRCELEGNEVKIVVRDSGVGIKDIDKAREPFFTTKPSEERSGMGFAVMESFMDKVEVVPYEGSGLIVTMYKRFYGGIYEKSIYTYHCSFSFINLRLFELRFRRRKQQTQ